jgi:hypothetical protein
MRFQPIAAAVLLAPLAIATGAAAAPAGCVPAGLGTLRASGAARIFSQGSTLYGCLGARTTRLGSLRPTTPFPATRVALYALSPRYAGIDTVEMGVDTLSSTVKLVDLQAGRTTATAAATTPERRAESFVSVTAIALSATGTLAWIGERSAVGAFTPIYEVHTLSAAGHRLLASAANIRPRSLRLHGDTLSWQAGGHNSSATL